MAVRSLALCAGIGGLDLGVAAALRELGLEYRLVGVVERQAHCAAVLVARMAEKKLDTAPIWDDLLTFDARPWVGAVDLITAGFPCQPVSVAGKRAGAADDRWLWPAVLRTVRDVRPRYVFLENVPGLLSKGIDRVLGDLAEIGFDAEWDCVPAASVGAPHRRDRLFILARDRYWAAVDASNSDEYRRESQRGRWLQHGERAALRDDANGRGGSRTTDAECPRLQGLFDEGGEAQREVTAERGASAINTDGAGLQRPRGAWEVGGVSVRVGGWWAERSPPESTFRRVHDGVPSELDRDWADRIHELGNAVVSQAAARAFVALWRRFE